MVENLVKEEKGERGKEQTIKSHKLLYYESIKCATRRMVTPKTHAHFHSICHSKRTSFVVIFIEMSIHIFVSSILFSLLFSFVHILLYFWCGSFHLAIDSDLNIRLLPLLAQINRAEEKKEFNVFVLVALCGLNPFHLSMRVT